MRSLVSLLVFMLVISPAAVQAQDPEGADNLSDEQRKEYSRRRIYVELSGQIGMANFSEYAPTVYQSNRRWQAYKGMEKLEEPELFRLGGYEAEALQVEDRNKRLDATAALGLLFAIGGTIAMLLALRRTTKESLNGSEIEVPDPDVTLVYVGGAVAGAGLGITIRVGFQKQQSYAPYGLAREAALQYNKQLILTITKEFE